MIVIRRKPGESIWVGSAEVKILSLSSTRVKVGIEAPRELRVMRSEMVASIAQNQLAAQAKLPRDLASLLDSLKATIG